MSRAKELLTTIVEAEVGEFSHDKGGLIKGKWLARDTSLHTNDGWKMVEAPRNFVAIINALKISKEVLKSL